MAEKREESVNEKLPSDFLDMCKKWRKYKVLW